MNQNKKAQVILLPTQDNNSLLAKYILDASFEGIIKEGELCTQSNKGWSNVFRPQHLYIISDDEIKEGDWFINMDRVFKCKSIEFHGIVSIHGDTYNKELSKKIISTTDTSLANKCIRKNGTITDNYSNVLHQPSQQFIEEYIKFYNKGDVITEVLVKYEAQMLNISNHIYHGNKLLENIKLKVNSKNNTITIKKVKDNYNRKEVVNIINQYTIEMASEIKNYHRDKWIEKNL